MPSSVPFRPSGLRRERIENQPFRSPGKKQGTHSQNPGILARRRSRCERLVEVEQNSVLFFCSQAYSGSAAASLAHGSWPWRGNFHLLSQRTVLDRHQHCGGSVPVLRGFFTRPPSAWKRTGGRGTRSLNLQTACLKRSTAGPGGGARRNAAPRFGLGTSSPNERL
jgi:hypothetical protein